MFRVWNNVSMNFDKFYFSLWGEKWNVIGMNEKFCLYWLIGWLVFEIIWVLFDCGGV